MAATFSREGRKHGRDRQMAWAGAKKWQLCQGNSPSG